MKRTHHGRQVDRIDGSPPCFSQCGKAAGNRTHPLSAYCESDQPTREPIVGGAYGCARRNCRAQFGRLTDWSAHLLDDGSCLDPADLPGDLIQDPATGVWQTAEGIQKRAAASARLRRGDRADG